MYYSKNDEILYLSNPLEKLFITPTYLEHVSKSGSKIFNFDKSWTIYTIDIVLNDSKKVFPVAMRNKDLHISVDDKQSIVYNRFNDFFAEGLLKNSLSAYTVSPSKFYMLYYLFCKWNLIMKETNLKEISQLNLLPNDYTLRQDINDVNMKHLYLNYLAFQFKTNL